MKNNNLLKAKKEKNDEFYTQLVDIENELQHYEHHFKDKVVYLNCDAEWSNFYIYFKTNQERLGIKKILRSNYDATLGVGDFRSDEAIELLKECDIVVSNPPFSLFREFIDVLMTYEKKFLIVGNMNAITYKETFKLIKENRIWLGISTPKEFIQPDTTIKKFGNICWFTNLEHKKRNEKLILWKEFNESEYLKYDNYWAWEVSKTAEIPVNDEIEVILTEEELEELRKTNYEFEIMEVIND
jgi:hypothetical protein